MKAGFPKPTAEEAKLSDSGGSCELSLDERAVRLQDCQHGRNRLRRVLNPPLNRSRIGLAEEPPENRRGLEIDRAYSPRSRSRIRCAVPAGSRTGGGKRRSRPSPRPELATSDPFREERRELIELIVAWLTDLRNDLVPVGDEDADSALDLPQVCAQVVFQILDPDPYDGLHSRSVATRRYLVKPWP